MINTDGAPKLKSSKTSILPIYLIINELPKQVHLNKPVTCGLWIHKKKTDMTVFLDKFVDVINPLSNDGFKCKIKNEERLLKLYILTCMLETMARGPVVGLIQFNGYYGCAWCLILGVHDGSMRYPYYFKDAEARTHEKTIEIMLRVAETKVLEWEVENVSALMILKKFDVVWAFGPDHLHFDCEGTIKQFAYLFEKLLSLSDIAEIDETLKNLSVPKKIGRLSASFSCRKDWKAKEWENFALYYSVTLFSKYLPLVNMKDWLLYVESMHILLQDEIHISELNKAHEMLQKFVSQTEDLHGLEQMTYNLHQCMHICEYILKWGLMWTNSTFAFETANYYLLRMIKSSRGALLQMVRHVNTNHTLMILEDYLKRNGGEESSWCIDDILSRRVQNVHKSINSISYFGRGYFDNTSYDILKCFNLEEISTKFYYKIVKDSCLYESCLIQKCRSNNSFALLKNGTFIQIVGFILDINNHETTVCKIVQTEYYFLNCNKIEKIIEVSNDLSRISTLDIERICVFIHAEKDYLSPVPNLIHY